ncbi:hypothetical protein [Actinoalloteichus hymeniacidonis]|uniref:Uncharacterized protein n=1 Tax=Actinoalloteichus hymeniacidonis TaxID=340345 RepID=A0AAC9HLG4_9PSEU|nr:hypothetical protein [Actinoalloteichus hymeniacidonis]AOS60936.1 hypothetical protein TL08_00440 [Actinoalloteichus hymeniacidonis]MBB5911064.1 hypothetical protein [Actinoalloteichus hymeniacidonis]
MADSRDRAQDFPGDEPGISEVTVHGAEPTEDPPGPSRRTWLIIGLVLVAAVVVAGVIGGRTTLDQSETPEAAGETSAAAPVESAVRRPPPNTGELALSASWADPDCYGFHDPGGLDEVVEDLGTYGASTMGRSAIVEGLGTPPLDLWLNNSEDLTDTDAEPPELVITGLGVQLHDSGDAISGGSVLVGDCSTDPDSAATQFTVDFTDGEPRLSAFDMVEERLSSVPMAEVFPISLPEGAGEHFQLSSADIDGHVRFSLVVDWTLDGEARQTTFGSAGTPFSATEIPEGLAPGRLHDLDTGDSVAWPPE